MSIKISHNLNIGTDWIEEIKVQLNSTFVNENTLVFSEQYAKGYFYFKKIMPGLMVQIIDFTSLEEIEFTRLASNEDFYILHYHLDDKIKNDTNEILKSKEDISSVNGFSVIPNHIVTRYIAKPLERRFSVVITISRFLFEKYLGDSLSKAIKNKSFNLENSIYHFNKIDSRTMVLLLKLRELEYNDPSYRFSVKGNILQILGYSVSRLKWEDYLYSNELKDKDYEEIVKSKDYLITHLYDSFPTIDFLAKMTGMSGSKYRSTFKKIYHYTPREFFIREKLFAAKKMLQSGGYRDIKSIAYDLGFGSIINFSRLYFLRFRVLPKNHFVKFKQR